MEQLRRNEVIDLLSQYEILYTIGNFDSIIIQLPKYGQCTYWSRKDRLHIHNGNDWKYDGYYLIRNILTGETK